MSRTPFSLDGPWDFFIDPDSSLAVDRLDGRQPLKVKVPAPWQTQSPELRHYSGTAWYRRSFFLPAAPISEEEAWILGFGAVDYNAEVFVNGRPVGEHEGGYLPFELDITAAVQAGENSLAVRASDPLELFAELPHGKQSWYGQLSGIWQPVWMERRPAVHIQRVRVTPWAADGRVEVEARLNQLPAGPHKLRLEALDPEGERVAEAEVQFSSPVLSASLQVPDPLLWELDTPRLYTLRASLPGPQPDIVDETFGFRTVESREGRLLLNGQPVYLRGALDQDYYPDLDYTPPSGEFIEDQFRQAKAMGLNCLRIHIKIGDPRYYAAADRAGLLIWTELPNWDTLTPEAQRRAQETLAGMVERDWNHPSIVVWTVINESWGIDLTDPEQRLWLAETYDFLKELDPNRLVVGNSACKENYQVVTDVEDFHNYYAMPDHYRKWRSWVRNFSRRPDWAYAHEYRGYLSWQSFRRNPWKRLALPLAAEVRRRGDEPLIVSEFGNWGLPDPQGLYECYGGEPWWFESGLEWGQGVVYPHGIRERFFAYHLERAFPDLGALIQASQRGQWDALKYQIEQIRLQESLSGYIITEFTDVHWESNGLLDVCRRPKLAAREIDSVNSENVILPVYPRQSYWEGERCRVELSVSQFSPGDLQGSRIEWRLDQRPDICGELENVQPRFAAVTRLGWIEFVAPEVTSITSMKLEFCWRRADGSPVACNSLELFFYPRQAGEAPPLRLYAPELSTPLSELGCHLAAALNEADAVVTLNLTDELRDYLLGGGLVLWLAESEQSQKTYLRNLKIRSRKESVWEGDWASSLTWIHQDRLFSGLPTSGLVNFAFADLTPEHVIDGLKPIDYATRVHAGLAVGWLHKGAGVVVETPLGRGKALISTFRLSRSLGQHPMASVLLSQMLKYLGQERRQER